MKKQFCLASAICFLLTTAGCNATASSVKTNAFPDPAFDAQLANAKGQQTAVVAGGCFWGLQALFEHVKGVSSVKAGYSGGAAATAQYEIVSDGESGHAESVQIVYDPSQITYGQILKVFFAVAHDPTELNRQGPDTGTQYRSAVFYSGPEQKRIAEAYIAQLNQARVFSKPIVTQVTLLQAFYEAEAYHQDYAITHPNEPYIVINDLPKVKHLHDQFPALYVGK
jgi:peptide-methionine (S)-S-oxide reductase